MSLGYCPSCLQYQTVLVVHAEEERSTADEHGYEIPEEHRLCINCDWNTCGFD